MRILLCQWINTHKPTNRWVIITPFKTVPAIKKELESNFRKIIGVTSIITLLGLKKLKPSYWIWKRL